MSADTVHVLDTHAVLAYVQGEAHSATVRRLMAEAQRGHVTLHMCSVNVAEVLYIMWRRGGEEAGRRTVDTLGALGIIMHDASLALALQAGSLKAQNAIALGDCFAAALAQQLGATLVTGDPEFRVLEPAVRIMWIGAGR